jgi:hypothetical protein
VLDIVALCKPIEGGNIGCSIVCNDLLDSSPSAQDFFEEEGTKGGSSLGLESTPLWPCSERTSSLNNVSEATCMGHEHGIDVGFAKEGCQRGDSGWDLDFRCLADLAFVAGLDVPSNIVSE